MNDPHRDSDPDPERTPDVNEAGAENYPETLRITVGTPEESIDQILDRVDGEPADEAVRSFDSAATVRQLLSDRRIEIMREIMADPPESIQALADRLDRNYADVHADVTLLADHRIVYFETSGRAKRPVIPYESVEFDVTVTPQPA